MSKQDAWGIHVLARTYVETVLSTRDGDVWVFACASLGLSERATAGETRRASATVLRALFTRIADDVLPEGWLLPREARTRDAILGLSDDELVGLVGSRSLDVALLALVVCARRSRHLVERAPIRSPKVAEVQRLLLGK